MYVVMYTLLFGNIIANRFCNYYFSLCSGVWLIAGSNPAQCLSEQSCNLYETSAAPLSYHVAGS